MLSNNKIESQVEIMLQKNSFSSFLVSNFKLRLTDFHLIYRLLIIPFNKIVININQNEKGITI